jgi:6,7-dimethyl-8-ribityllumazine synthase
VVQHRLPIINGIVVTDDLATAEERITGKLDRGKEFAHAALEMASLRKKWI